MKNIILYTLLAAGAVTAFSSCGKELGALPSQARVEGTVAVDQKTAEVALNGVYNRFVQQTTYRSLIATGWTQTRELFPAQLAGFMQYAFGRSDLENRTLLQPSGTAGYWTPNYSLLNAANVTIEEVSALADSKFTGTRKVEILAEARFLRAFAHFNLLAFFSEWYKPESPLGVMLRKEPLRLSNAAQKRSTVKESYDYILADLDYAIANAADVRPVYYANKTAAKVLKLRVLILRAQGTDLADAITLANEIIGNPAYELEPNLRDLFQVKGLTSKEVILGVTPYPMQEAKRGVYTFIQSATWFATKEFRDLLAGDPRAAWMYAPVGTSHPSTNNYRDSVYLTKYTGPKIEEGYVFRLTEVHLMKAEAIVRSGGSLVDARTILKNIVSKAGVTNFAPIDNATTPLALQIEIYKEFSRNMVAETGAEWLALLRLPFATVQQLRPTIVDQRQYILPIPTTEFQLNPTIGDQNTGYNKE